VTTYVLQQAVDQLRALASFPDLLRQADQRVLVLEVVARQAVFLGGAFLAGDVTPSDFRVADAARPGLASAADGDSRARTRGSGPR
jgi:hypothetical protein